MNSSEWGSKEWNEAHFPINQLDTDGETWGFRWRGMEKMRHDSYLSSLKTTLQSKDALKILDLGCALCDFTHRAWKLNPNNYFYGMDISENAIAWGEKKFPMFELKAGALPRIPFDEKFDVIFCLEVICYLDPSGRKDTITNINRSLTQSGTLIFSGVLDGGKIHHTEEEVLGLINTEFDIKTIFYNYWKYYRRLIQYPFDTLMDRMQIIKDDINKADLEFDELIQHSKSSKAIFLRIFRSVNPLSSIVLTGTILAIKSILSSKFIALVFSHLSKVLLGKNKADEIVVIAKKKTT